MPHLSAYYFGHGRPYIDPQFSQPDLRPVCVPLSLSLDQLLMNKIIHIDSGRLVSLCGKTLSVRKPEVFQHSSFLTDQAISANTH